MTETSKPSPGALRAAKEITKIFDDSIMKNELKGTIDRLAEIIDREMNADEGSAGASELLAAMKKAEQEISAIQYLYKADEHFTRQAMFRRIEPVRKEIEAAIAKAEGMKAKAKGESQ